MARPGGGSTASSRRLTPGLFLLTAGCLLAAGRAGVLAPEWSRPLDAAVISAAVGANAYKTERLFLLLADGRVLSVSAGDTLREVGRAPQGATALVAMPTPAPGANDIALMLAVGVRPGASDIVAWNGNGQQLWRAAVAGMAVIDSFSFVGEGENRAELCAWQRGEPWLITVEKELWQYSARAVPLETGFIPSDALIGDFDRDEAPELVFFDGVRLAVYHVGQGRELHCRWPVPDSASKPGSAARTPRPRIACASFESDPVLLVVTGDTLRYVNALSGDEERRFLPDSVSDLPGPPVAVVASGPIAYAAGTDGQGRCYLAGLAPRGLPRPRMALSLPVGARVTALALLKDWPMFLVSTRYGPENLLLYSPGLAGNADNSPGYSGARFLRVMPLRIDDDTFPDLVVLRTAADARWRLDVFSNRTGQLAHEVEQARRTLLRAALGQDDNTVRRAVRRLRALEREVGAGGSGQEGSTLDRFRMTTRRRRLLAYAGAFVAAILAAGLGSWVLARRRRATPGQQIEKMPVANRVALAADLIALDHNFMSKGNRPAGFERLIEIRNSHGLEHDRDLGQSGRVSSEQLTGVYTGAITRLIDATPTLPLLDFLLTTARSAPRGRDCEFQELSLQELRQLEREPGVRLTAVANHEYPDYHRRFRLFANPEVRGTLEHIVLDHIRHAATWAHMIVRYTVNTQWNRRLVISFRSDSPTVIPFSNPRAHITTQLRELAAQLRPAIEVSRDAGALVGPHERLWLSISDYIVVLEEARSRLSVP